jgi:hypothetical protein
MQSIKPIRPFKKGQHTLKQQHQTQTQTQAQEEASSQPQRPYLGTTITTLM